MDRDGLNHQAAPTEGQGDSACTASIAQVDLIYKLILGWHSFLFSW